MDDNEYKIRDKELEVRTREVKNARERFWIGGVVIVLLTSIVNWQFQYKEVRLKEVEAENNHLSTFVNNIISKDPWIRIRVAEYFHILSGGEELQNRWKKYLEIAKAEINKKQELSKLMRTDGVLLKQKLDELESARARGPNRSRLRREIDDIKERLIANHDAIVAIDPSLAPSMSDGTGNSQVVANDNGTYSAEIPACGGKTGACAEFPLKVEGCHFWHLSGLPVGMSITGLSSELGEKISGADANPIVRVIEHPDGKNYPHSAVVNPYIGHTVLICGTSVEQEAWERMVKITFELR